MNTLFMQLKYHYADFSGSISQREYVLACTQLAVLLFAMVLITLNALAIIRIPLALGYLYLITSVFSMSARRLHDIGLSGWLALVLFIPYVNILALIALFFIPGKKGEILHADEMFRLY